METFDHAPTNHAPAKGTGAFRSSWRARNPRAILEEIVAANPREKGQTDREYEAALLVFFEDAARKADESTISTIIEYWFTNNYRSLMRATAVEDPDAVRLRKLEAEKITQSVRSAIDAKIKATARIMLMDLMMPNGKRLRACTGRECTRLGSSVGRWLSLIGKSIGPTQRVGEALSEDKLHEFYESAS